jgi:hypothetical protein
MSKREIAAMFCKLLALYTLTLAIGVLQYILPMMTSMVTTVVVNNNTPFGRTNAQALQMLGLTFLGYSSVVALFLLLAFFLWFKADEIANRMVPALPDEPPVDMRGVDLQTLLYSGLGLFLIVQALPILIAAGLIFILNCFRWYSGDIRLPYYDLATFVRLLIGLWLFLGTRHVIGSVHRFQQWARPQSPASSHSSAEPPVA